MVYKPKEVNILGINYKISYCKNPADVNIDKQKVLWGEHDPWTRTIRLYDKDKPIEDIWQVLIHEILHGISDMLHLKMDTTTEDHDKLDIIALAMVDVLVRNKWMVIEDE